MANVNFNRSRYRIPKLIAKVEGRGIESKTVIVNMPEIAKSLNRPPMYPTKHLGCQLGARVNFDTKTERYIVNGAHDPNKLQDLLAGFVQRYVLCQSCDSPKTIISVKKEKVCTKCIACGYMGAIPSAKEPVAAYILKNPPPEPTPAIVVASAESLAHPEKVLQRKYESTGQYFRRLDRLVAKAKVEASLESRFDMSLKERAKRKSSDDQMELKESRKRRRRKRY